MVVWAFSVTRCLNALLVLLIRFVLILQCSWTEPSVKGDVQRSSGLEIMSADYENSPVSLNWGCMNYNFFFWQNFTNSISAFALKHDFEGFCKVFHIASQILNSRALNVYPQHLFCVVLYQLILTNNQIRINVVFEAFELATTDKHTSALDGQVFPLFTEHIFYFKFPRISNTEFVCYLKWNFLIGFPMVTPKWYLFDCNLTVIFSKAQFSGKYLTFYAHNKKTSG